jgi:hypothetical protein
LTIRTFYQSHECDGFRAKVTIEWSMPRNVDADRLPAQRTLDAEDIADSILAFSGEKDARHGPSDARFQGNKKG